MDSINTRIAEELSALPSGRVQPQQVAAAVALLDEGSTVPFIARYRKEVTGSLDDTQLRMLEERLRYLRELEERRGAILASIEEQGKLTPNWPATSSLPTPRPVSKTSTCLISEAPGPDRPGSRPRRAGRRTVRRPDPGPGKRGRAFRRRRERLRRRQGGAGRRQVHPHGALRRRRHAARQAARVHEERSDPDRPRGPRQGTGRRQVQRLLPNTTSR